MFWIKIGGGISLVVHSIISLHIITIRMRMNMITIEDKTQNTTQNEQKSENN